MRRTETSALILSPGRLTILPLQNRVSKKPKTQHWEEITMRQRFTFASSALVLAVLFAAAGLGHAQQQRQGFSIFLPATSPKASASQTVGVTDISIT